ncbi:MAG: hypothetical protein QM479_01215 [Pseudomonadota bacterium]
MKSFIAINIVLLFFCYKSYAVQDVYQYQDKQGLVEFTDKVKNNQKPVKQFQFNKETVAEKAQREEKLELLRQQNKEIDKRVKLQQQLDNQRLINLQKQQEIEKLKQQSLDRQNTEQYNQGRYYRGGRWYYPPIIKPPHYPVKPVHPIEKPGIKPGLDPLAPARM